MSTSNKTIHSHILGFPRIGAARELTFALEANWRGELPDAQLEAVGRDLRARHWALQRRAGLDYVSVGDFAYYDQVANHIQLLGCEPARYGFTPEQSQLSRYFTMARGHQHSRDGGPRASAALEMSKWFDTKHHYLVPEFTPETAFSLACERLFDEVAEAQALGHAVKAVLLGPLSFLWLGKEKADGFDRLSLLDRLLPVYGQLLDRLKAQGVQWVQVDEPILGLDLPSRWRNAFENVYWQLNQVGVPLLLATYFSPLEENLSLACRLPVAGLHVDGVRAAHELTSIADWLPVHKVLSIGIVDGRNIWRTDLDQALAVLAPIVEKRAGKLWLSASCSLLHTPFTLAAETALDGEISSWLAFATEKLDELHVLKQALQGEYDVATSAALKRSRAAIAGRRASPRVHQPAVRGRIQALPGDADQRRQQAPGLDAPARGDAKRHDKVEYFGERLDGFVFTQLGWVQSHGSRCVKPPIIFGDVSRPKPMTVDWPAQALRLAGPVTMLQCSFVRDDQPRSLTALQIALAIRDEVADLRRAGVDIIQIDEPDVREGLPLRRGRWDEYLHWAARAFRVSAGAAVDGAPSH